MRILLVDVDKKFPNLALMKISSYHKEKGDEVYLNYCPNPDLIYVSCVFTWNRKKALQVGSLFKERVIYGGSGIDLSVTLPDEIEHICPDYSLYGIDFSMGFTSRGCMRKCGFCIVPRKEGYIREHSPLSEFVRHEKVMLLDNNFLASPKAKEKLIQLIGKKVCFNQGLDIRLINDDFAKLLSHIEYYDSKFNRRRLYFAWDNIKDEKLIMRGIEIVKQYIPTEHLRFYMLVGYNITPEEYTWRKFIEEDYYRFEKLTSLGAEPFVMVYNNRRDIPILRHFARWVNYHLYIKIKRFEDYQSGNSQRVIEAIKCG